ncbi:MAG: RsmE family RNA methyltransferase [Balneolaceae bacterium]|nr:RsmE family RNA methyltransferase [Balneolaceae bacterium]
MGPLFYAPPVQVSGRRIRLEGQEAHHAARVLRLGPGDPVAVADGRGTRYQGSVVSAGKNGVIVEWASREELPRPDPYCVLAMGILKKRDRMEFAVEKAVELGAGDVALFRSQHTVKENVRMDRLESAALAAMKQSRRAWLPGITLHDSLAQVLESHPDTRPLLARQGEGGYPEELPDREGDSFLLLVGPEGGFSEEEMRHALEAGAEPVRLGGYRLRTETAAVALLSRMLPEG